VSWQPLEQLVAQIDDGARVAIPPDYSGVAMAATYALLSRGVRDLHLVAVPQAGLQADLLIGAGCVKIMEAAGVSLGEIGLAPRFREWAQQGRLQMMDATCPAIQSGLQAAEKGIPFMPIRGILGSDLVALRDQWQVIDNPYGEDDPILLVPAIRPDVALFHAPLADSRGNVWVGVRRELMLMAHASATTLVTVEENYDGDLLADPVYAAGTIPHFYITGTSLAPGGMRPLGFFGDGSVTDSEHLIRYEKLARSEEGFFQYLEEQKIQLAGVNQ